MSDSLTPFNVVLFDVVPYLAIALFVAGTVERFVRHPASMTSRSSQFLENRQHFWALVPFHYGLLFVLAGHAAAFAAPRAILGWNASTARLYALEITGLASAILAFAGLTTALARRVATTPLRRITTAMDWAVLSILLVQIVLGILIAVNLSWGSSWFAAVASPYLWSLVRLHPEGSAIASLPLTVRAHVLGAFFLIALLPFTRLVHVLNVPIAYLWRRPQVVRWTRTRPLPLEH